MNRILILICTLLMTSTLSSVTSAMDINGANVIEQDTTITEGTTTSFMLGGSVLFSGAGSNLNNWAMTPPISLSGTSITLRIWTQYEIVAPDFGHVIISTDNVTWTVLASFTGSQPNWIKVEIDLSAYAGQIIWIGFDFNTQGNSASLGWHIDDIEVQYNTSPPTIVYSETFEGYLPGSPPTGWTFNPVYPHGWKIVEKVKPHEFILVSIDEWIYYIPWSSTSGFGNPVLIDDPQGTDLDGRIVDFDNDGDFDVLLVVLGTDGFFHVLVYENTPYCFVRRWESVMPYQGTSHLRVVGGDFNIDAYWDFIVLENFTETFYGYQNMGNFHFSLVGSLSLSTSWTDYQGTRIWDLESGDFNKDGLRDLLVNNYGPGYQNGKVAVYLGAGSWIFGAPAVYINRSGQPIPAMVTGDFIDNNVCSLDVVVGLDDDADAGQTWLYGGDGMGKLNFMFQSFDVSPSFESGSNHPGVGQMDAKDFDKDGELDLVVSYEYQIGIPHRLVFMTGNGDGTFNKEILIRNATKLIAAPEDQINPTVGIIRPVANRLYFDDLLANGIPWFATWIKGGFFIIPRFFTIRANADDSGCWSLAGVEFSIDNAWRSTVFFGSTGTPPYSWRWPLPNGLLHHVITVASYDNAGNRADDTMQVLTIVFL